MPLADHQGGGRGRLQERQGPSCHQVGAEVGRPVSGHPVSPTPRSSKLTRGPDERAALVSIFARWPESCGRANQVAN